MKRLCLCLLLGAPVAAEDCPTVEDAARGITVRYDDGSRSVFTLDPATGALTEDWTDAEGLTIRNLMEAGIHLTSSYQLEADGSAVPDSSVSYSYDPPPPQITAPGGHWSIPYASAFGVVQGSSGTYSGTVGDETWLAIGPCSYRALPVEMVLSQDEFTSLSQVDYLPDLRLSVLRGFGPDAGQITRVVPLSIGREGAP